MEPSDVDNKIEVDNNAVRFLFAAALHDVTLRGDILGAWPSRVWLGRGVQGPRHWQLQFICQIFGTCPKKGKQAREEKGEGEGERERERKSSTNKHRGSLQGGYSEKHRDTGACRGCCQRRTNQQREGRRGGQGSASGRQQFFWLSVGKRRWRHLAKQ